MTQFWDELTDASTFCGCKVVQKLQNEHLKEVFLFYRFTIEHKLKIYIQDNNLSYCETQENVWLLKQLKSSVFTCPTIKLYCSQVSKQKSNFFQILTFKIFFIRQKLSGVVVEGVWNMYLKLMGIFK